MEIKKLDILGRIGFVGSGRVIAKNGQPAVHTVLVGGTPKAYFNVAFSMIKTEQGDYKYENYICAVYGKQFNIALYQLCTTLQRNETVEVTGFLMKNQGKDARTGEDRMYEEVFVETLVPVNRIYDLLLKMEGTDADKLVLQDIINVTPGSIQSGDIDDDDF